MIIREARITDMPSLLDFQLKMALETENIQLEIQPLTLGKRLNEFNLQIIHSKDEQIIESIKLEVKRYLDQVEQHDKAGKFSDFVERRLSKNYYNLSKLFSRTEKMTIEAYLIRQRIERVKRLLREDQLTLNEIADRLHYTNVQHLSSQFRKVTGFSVREYKKLQRTEHAHKSLMEVLTEIHTKGFVNAFDIHKNKIIVAGNSKSVKDVTIKEVYRFDETPNSLGDNALYTPQANAATEASNRDTTPTMAR